MDDDERDDATTRREYHTLLREIQALMSEVQRQRNDFRSELRSLTSTIIRRHNSTSARPSCVCSAPRRSSRLPVMVGGYSCYYYHTTKDSTSQCYSATMNCNPTTTTNTPPIGTACPLITNTTTFPPLRAVPPPSSPSLLCHLRLPLLPSPSLLLRHFTRTHAHTHTRTHAHTHTHTHTHTKVFFTNFFTCISYFI